MLHLEALAGSDAAADEAAQKSSFYAMSCVGYQASRDVMHDSAAGGEQTGR